MRNDDGLGALQEKVDGKPDSRFAPNALNLAPDSIWLFRNVSAMQRISICLLAALAVSGCATLAGPSATDPNAGVPAGCRLIKSEPAKPGVEQEVRSTLVCGESENKPKLPPLQERYASKEALLEELAKRPEERGVLLDDKPMKLGFGRPPSTLSLIHI